MQRIVVRQRVAANVVVRVRHADVACRAPDHDGHLAFVVQEAAALGANDAAAMTQKARRRLREVVGSRRAHGLQLLQAVAIVQMRAEDLARLDRRQVHYTFGAHPPSVRCHQLSAIAHDFYDGSVEQDAASLENGHDQGAFVGYPRAA